MLTGIGQFVCTTDHQRIIGIVDDTFQGRHCLRVDDRCHVISHEKKTGFRVVHDVVNLFSVKLMQDGHSNGTIGEGSEKCYCPLR